MDFAYVTRAVDVVVLQGLTAHTESETLHFVLLRQASICLRLSVEGDSPNPPMFRSDGPCGYLKVNRNPAFGGVSDFVHLDSNEDPVDMICVFGIYKKYR